MKKTTKPNKGKPRKAKAPKSTSSLIGVSRQVQNKTGTSVTITHREKLFDVAGSGTTTYSCPVNPGNQTCHPWLYNIARSFEYYHYSNIKFSYVSTCSATTTGKVVMAVDYDVSDSIAIMASVGNWDGTITCAVRDPGCLTLAPKHLNMFPNRYVASTNADNSPDPRMRDSGRFYLFTTTASNEGLGTLFVDYTVTLSCPCYDTGMAMSLTGKTKKPVATQGNPFPIAYSQILTNTLTGLVLNRQSSMEERFTEFVIKQAGTYLLQAALPSIKSTSEVYHPDCIRAWAGQGDITTYAAYSDIVLCPDTSHDGLIQLLVDARSASTIGSILQVSMLGYSNDEFPTWDADMDWGINIMSLPIPASADLLLDYPVLGSMFHDITWSGYEAPPNVRAKDKSVKYPGPWVLPKSLLTMTACETSDICNDNTNYKPPR